MPWWSWIVIWIALVALSLLFFVVLGVRLFRQFMATVKELGEAGERFGHLPTGPVAPGSAGVHVGPLDSNGAGGTAAADPPGSAVFAPPARMRHEYHAFKLARQEARRLRRIQRKRDRGQPQALRDIEFS
ncbi:hypothetical protein BJG92_02363 [Arthrobacter sp. SO5]|uniref:alkaline shock response membrane anchor protein AmaP n=1 Tax=Arthrobacter sp. SO5 TaxID=1897055 RepID=UPI001E5F71CA|nr:alkaline shock response membrane anchor protein AmaP [Arthrobacter sp. SO5]MCB5274826.1 hypothetical protein [Arthrobacter sp. SO5]